MEREVMVAVPPPSPPPPPPPPSLPPIMDFNFDSNCSSPYITAPSSPQRFGNSFFSAPTSPTRNVPSSSFFRHSSASSSSSSSSVPEPIHHINNINHVHDQDSNEDFEFNFGGLLERPFLSADELFHGGKIRPLNKPSSPSRELVQERATRKRAEEVAAQQQQQQNKRGKERASSFSIPSSRDRGSGRRSFKVSSVSDSDRHSSVSESDDVFSSQRGNNNDNNNKGVPKASETAATFSSFLSSISFSRGYRKWRFKDFLLFRSASEGRATDKDPLRRKYAVLSKTTAHEDVVCSSSFRSTESSGSASRRRGPVSAHELHYTMNRAASEELKKKTMLPYKQGLLGCLGFNHGIHHISARFGSFERS